MLSIESGPTVLGIHEHLLASIPGVLLLLDDRGIVRFASGQLEHLGGRPVDVLVGSELSSYLEPRDRPLLDRAAGGVRRQVAGAADRTGPAALSARRRDGSARRGLGAQPPGRSGTRRLRRASPARERLRPLRPGSRLGPGRRRPRGQPVGACRCVAAAAGARGVFLCRRLATTAERSTVTRCSPSIPGPARRRPLGSSHGARLGRALHRARRPARRDPRRGRGRRLPFGVLLPDPDPRREHASRPASWCGAATSARSAPTSGRRWTGRSSSRRS